MSDTPTLAELLDELVHEARDVERYTYVDGDIRLANASRAEVNRLKAAILAHCSSGPLPSEAPK